MPDGRGAPRKPYIKHGLPGQEGPRKLSQSGWLSLAQISCPRGCFSFRVLSLCHTSGRQLPPLPPAGGPSPLQSRMTTPGNIDLGTVALGTLFTYCHFLGTFLSCLFCLQWLVRPGLAPRPLHHLRILEPELCGEPSTHLTHSFSDIAFKMPRTHKLHSQWQNRKPLVLFP